MRVLYRGKRLDNNEWIISSLIQVYLTGVLLGELDENTDITMSPDDLRDNVRWYEVDKTTLCMATEYDTYSYKEVNPEEVPIFDKDIVEIETFSGQKFRYIVWYMEEGSSFTATIWDEESIENRDTVFIEYPVNFKREISWAEFVLIVQDPYRHNKAVKVLGNYFDNPEMFLSK